MIAAHISKTGEEQTVYEHLHNVGAYCSIYGEKIGLKSCGLLVGLLHDMGKLTEKFNTYIHEASDNPGQGKKGPDHSTAGAAWIMSQLEDCDAGVKQMTAQLIAMVIMWHHGGLGDIFDEMGNSRYLRRLMKTADPQWKLEYERAAALFFAEFKETYVVQLFEEAIKEQDTVFQAISKRGFSNKEKKYAMGMVGKYLYSCLIDADRYDTATFMDGRAMEPPADNHDLWQVLSSRAEKRYESMSPKRPIDFLRMELSDNCFKNAEAVPAVYTLNCPTGSGKTLTSLRYALSHAKQYRKERIFYIVPLISIIDQNSKVLKEFLSQSGNDPLIHSSFLELHSAKEQDCFDENQLREAELLAETMNLPIVVTTMVRFLNTFFKGGTRNPRAIHNFANSIIIFDEIQTVPIKCIALFNGLINFLTCVCGATVVLSTATQPGLDKISNPELPSLKVSSDTELSGCTDVVREQFRRTRFDLSLITGDSSTGNSVEEITSKMKDAGRENQHILGVFNTKRTATTVYEALKQQNFSDEEEAVSPYLLTANLCPAHRRDKLDEIKGKMIQGERVIVISTQLIEAGVDLSFDLVFRALAGLDSIIQAAGRCNRHGEKKWGTVYLMCPDFENLTSLGTIQRGIDSTKKLIRKYLEDPEAMGGALDSQQAINLYYTEYYKRQESLLPYPFTPKGQSNYKMYDLLSDNRKIMVSAQHNQKEAVDSRWKPVLCQSFSLAGRNFEPIDTNGRSVIVPYGKGKQIISQLLSQNSYFEKERLLRAAQQYCINISEGRYQAMKDGVEIKEELGISILKDHYYDIEEQGLLDNPVLQLLME